VYIPWTPGPIVTASTAAAVVLLPIGAGLMRIDHLETSTQREVQTLTTQQRELRTAGATQAAKLDSLEHQLITVHRELASQIARLPTRAIVRQRIASVQANITRVHDELTLVGSAVDRIERTSPPLRGAR